MTAPDHVLAIDLGTGGPKVAVVSLSGAVLAHEHRRVPTRTGPDGAATQDPDDWWAAITDATQALRGTGALDPTRLAAIAATGQFGSTVPVDATGTALGECLLWWDHRGREQARRHLRGRVHVAGYRPGAVLAWIRRSGGAPSPDGNDPLGHRLWIRHERPELHARTAWFLEPVDYLNLRLTGIVSATAATMLASWLTDNRVPDPASYDPRLVALAGTESDRLPPLRPIASVAGALAPPAAGELGLPSGIPVVAGLPDLHTAALGAGTVTDHHAHLCISTSAWVSCHHPAKRTSLAHQMATVPAVTPGRYLLIDNLETGGAGLEWLRDAVVAPADGLTSGRPSLAELDRLAATAPAGARGVIFTPWLKGIRSPTLDTSARASFVNLGLDNTRADLVRATLEGVAHHLRWLVETAEGVLRRPLTDLRLVGGGATSDLWCQIHADVLGRPVTRVEAPLLANVRGAALFAGIVLGRYGIEEVPARVPLGRTFVPDPATAPTHDRHQAVVRDLARSRRGVTRRPVGR